MADETMGMLLATIHSVELGDMRRAELLMVLRRCEAELDRLRAREAAAMAIVRQVDQADAIALRMAAQSAEYLGTGASDAGYDCQWCHQYILASNEHAPDCPITTARALLAQE